MNLDHSKKFRESLHAMTVKDVIEVLYNLCTCYNFAVVLKRTWYFCSNALSFIRLLPLNIWNVLKSFRIFIITQTCWKLHNQDEIFSKLRDINIATRFDILPISQHRFGDESKIVFPNINRVLMKRQKDKPYFELLPQEIWQDQVQKSAPKIFSLGTRYIKIS